MTISLTRQAQSVILANVLKGHQSALVLLNAIQPEDWTVQEYREVWKHLIDYWGRYKHLPSQIELIELVSPEAASELFNLYSVTEYEDVPVLVDKVIAYLKARKLRSIMDQAGYLLTTDPNTAEQVLRAGLSEVPTLTFDTDKVQDLLPDAVYDYDDKTFGLPTGIRILDKATRGGVGLGEVFIFAGPSASGKSTILSSICGTVSRMTPCLFVSLELKKERIVQLLAAKIGHMRQSELNDRLPAQKFVDLQNRIERCFPIRVVYYPSNSISVAQVGGMVDYLRNVEGINIGAVFIDYADLLVSSRAPAGVPQWERLGQVYQELEDMSRLFNVAVFTASQVQRGAGDKTNTNAIEQSQIAGSMDKINKCDIAVAFKPMSKDGNLTRGLLSFLKVRNGETPPTYEVTFDYDTLDMKVLHEYRGQDAVAPIGMGNYRQTAGVRRGGIVEA